MPESFAEGVRGGLLVGFVYYITIYGISRVVKMIKYAMKGR